MSQSATCQLNDESLLWAQVPSLALSMRAAKTSTASTALQSTATAPYVTYTTTAIQVNNVATTDCFHSHLVALLSICEVSFSRAQISRIHYTTSSYPLAYQSPFPTRLAGYPVNDIEPYACVSLPFSEAFSLGHRVHPMSHLKFVAIRLLITPSFQHVTPSTTSFVACQRCPYPVNESVHLSLSLSNNDTPPFQDPPSLYLKSAMDSDTSSLAHMHFINSLNRFERLLFAFDDKLAVNSTELAPLLGLDVLKASNAVTLHPTAMTASSKGEYKTLASIVSAYRMFEVLALDCEIGGLQPPIRLLSPLSFNKSEKDSEKIVGFDKLENWPKVLLKFRKLIGQSGLPQIPDDLQAGSKHLALLWMASKNKEKVGYINVVDNFLQAALHLYYLKMTQFPDGSLPDYPDILNDCLHIFKDETSTDEFINDQEEGTYYLEHLRDGETASHTLHQLGTPLQLALLLTPFYLLFPFQIITRSYNRRLVLEAFAELTPRKTPLVLKIERSIWCSLIALADVTITPHEALTQLVSRLPWAEIEAASNNPRDCQMFCTPLAQPSSSSTCHAITFYDSEHATKLFRPTCNM
ncbi:uncharacterized protein LACBIDRAFT_333639 [Laccaria bicolor S238N-H82]|uniref:Predicted protein n=1 Tax=Laccaria bicolor (strain S238N-H82 / ATCC MYA-4686) TaxID=486041 RepID=B0DWR1_LACBS|nr:uncharacterized protein LACBIDRAFT_333639 [Laccaria bicolor S238N-H82]EDR00937.1 predicted protein [Laccaria bicolor S238N-H82]|eukprot:XP_001888332.1 predicted protein [Laccaria bicolor S238N-H82]